MKVPKLKPLNLFGANRPQPAFAGAPTGDSSDSGMMFASGYDDDDGYDGDDVDDQPVRRPTARRAGNGGSSGGGGGRQRIVEFEPEERYWTEYLRIALPIIGLLLMIGVFWFWAQQLIDNGDDPTDPAGTTPPGGPTLVAGGASSPSPTRTPSTGATEASNPGGQQTTPNPADETPAANDEATDPPADEETPPAGTDAGAGGDFAEGDTALVSDDGVNIRSEPSTAGGADTVVGTLNADEEVTIVGGPEEDEKGDAWYQINFGDGESGYISADYLTSP